MSSFFTTEVEEGAVRLIVPDLSRYSVGGRVEPAWAPVFYNPKMANNRTMSVIAVSAYASYMERNELVLCEPLTSTGARAIRYAKEVPGVSKVFAGDINADAVKLAEVNAEANGVGDLVEVVKEDANVLLSRLKNRCDVVDVDPFGSPQPYLDSAFRSVKDLGLVCVTATDLAVLTGRHPHKCMKRYHAEVFPTPFGLEVGIRILIGYMGRVAASYGLRLEPLVSWYEGHYYRVCVLVVRSRKDSIDNMMRQGYVVYDRVDRRRQLVRGYPCPSERGMGPLWSDRLSLPLFLRYMMWEASRRPYAPEEVKKFIRTLYEESSAPPLYYLTYEFARFGYEPSREQIVRALSAGGFSAWFTHFDSRGFKTVAGVEEINESIDMYLK